LRKKKDIKAFAGKGVKLGEYGDGKKVEE